MKLAADDLQKLCIVAIEAAKQAGSVIQHKAGCDIAVSHKRAGTNRASQIVTDVDLMSQDVILQHIHPTCEEYDLGLLTEESKDDQSRFVKDYFWCVDPLDGTLPFVEHRPGYAVSIALVSSNGTSYLGVVYDPCTHTLYSAFRGSGTFRNGKIWEWAPKFNNSFEAIHMGGAVMNACWVLENAPSYFVKRPKIQEGGGCLWDYAATACLFEEIGATVSDSFGNPLHLNSRDSVFMNRVGVLYASHREISQALRV